MQNYLEPEEKVQENIQKKLIDKHFPFLIQSCVKKKENEENLSFVICIQSVRKEKKKSESKHDAVTNCKKYQTLTHL